jgi:RimJ/RimL family protein N-acetyltransferase
MSRKPQTDPGALLATTHAVGDGQRVRLRLARPSDEARVRAFLGELSPETRRRRFMAAMPVIPDALVRHFTFYEPRERLVVAATAPLGGSEQIVGLADVALLATGVAELGVVVEDRCQGRGVGKLLTEAAASLAVQNGARHLKAELLGENRAMLRLMERLGPAVHTTEDGHTVTYVKLPPRRRAAA